VYAFIEQGVAIAGGDRMEKAKSIVPLELVERTILVIRGQKVILDADLAKLYGASTKRLNQQVNRNRDRFPADFMFQLTAAEKTEVVANCNHLARVRKLTELEQRLEGHDERFEEVFEAIRQLMTPPDGPKKKIGFEVKEPKAAYGRSRKGTVK
jgi:hypothetical protein